jgi:hypothetical protein
VWPIALRSLSPTETWTWGWILFSIQVEGDGSGAPGLDVGEVDGIPEGRVRVVDLSAGPHDPCLGEAGDEARDEALRDVVLKVEVRQGSVVTPALIMA